MLPTPLQKREAASDWDERVFHRETCTSPYVCTLSVPEEGCLAIQAGCYYLRGFCLASEMLHAPDQYSHEGPGKGSDFECLLLQEKSPMIPELFNTINNHKQASIYHLFAIYTTTSASICYSIITCLLQFNLRGGKAESPSDICFLSSF